MDKISLRIPIAELFHTATSLMLAFLFAFLLYTGGTAIGRTILEFQRNYHIELFQKAVEENNLVMKVISDEKTHQIMSKYLAALSDAVIRFEFFPRMEDGEIFLEIIASLPDDLAIEQIAFTGRNLTIDCTARSKDSIVQFSDTLRESSFFQDTSLELYQKKDGSQAGTVTCIS